MNWKPLAVLVITYNRRVILLETLRRIKEHLGYQGETHYFIADDGSDDGTQDAVRAGFPDVTIVQNQRVGLGANTNAALRAAFAGHEYVMQLQDDLHLQMHLDMHPHIELMEGDPTASFVRLWGVGGHKYHGALEGNYWRIWWHSPELFIPSDRPHVKHRRFHAMYGLYPEGLLTGETEQAFCHQCKDIARKTGKPMDVFVPQNQLTETSWEHVGWHQRWRDQGL